MEVGEIKKVAVVGAGLMGPGIAQVFAQAGMDVSLHDIRGDALEMAMEKIKKSMDNFVSKKILSEKRAKEALKKIKTTTSLREAVEEADYVTEAALEVMEFKKDLFQKIDGLAPGRAILASNSSSLPIDSIADATGRADQVVLTHFLNPPEIIPVVEVVKGTKTSDETLDLTKALLSKAGKSPVILKKAIPSYLVNSFNMAILGTAISFVENGITSKEEIDELFKSTLGPRLSVLGPFEILDLFGLDLVRTAAYGMTLTSMGSKLWEPLYHSREIERLVKEGNWGVKTGKGFYEYKTDSQEPVATLINDRLLGAFQEIVKKKYNNPE